MTTVAPRRPNQAARATQALRVGSITTVTSQSCGSRAHNASSSSGSVWNR